MLAATVKFEQVSTPLRFCPARTMAPNATVRFATSPVPPSTPKFCSTFSPRDEPFTVKWPSLLVSVPLTLLLPSRNSQPPSCLFTPTPVPLIAPATRPVRPLKVPMVRSVPSSTTGPLQVALRWKLQWPANCNGSAFV